MSALEFVYEIIVEVIFRDVIQQIGLRCRYIFFKAIGKKVTLKMLATGVTDSSSGDYDPNGRYQAFSNGFVGFVVILSIIASMILVF